MTGYTTTQRMNDYVGAPIFADVTWHSGCTKNNGIHHLGLLSQCCLACRAKPTIRYKDAATK